MAELYRPKIKRVNKIISQLNDSHDSDEPIVNLTDIQLLLSITRPNPTPVSSNDCPPHYTSTIAANEIFNELSEECQHLATAESEYWDDSHRWDEGDSATASDDYWAFLTLYE